MTVLINFRIDKINLKYKEHEAANLRHTVQGRFATGSTVAN